MEQWLILMSTRPMSEGQSRQGTTSGEPDPHATSEASRCRYGRRASCPLLANATRSR